MLYYVIHQSPLWRDSTLTDGQRNIRILFVVIILYFVLHYIAHEYKNKNTLFTFINGYFYYIMIADLFLCACLYKSYYGRNITKELDTYEKDDYDEKKHTYVPKIETVISNKNIINKNPDKINSIDKESADKISSTDKNLPINDIDLIF
jgi:hypothetical protein